MLHGCGAKPAKVAVKAAVKAVKAKLAVKVAAKVAVKVATKVAAVARSVSASSAGPVAMKDLAAYLLPAFPRSVHNSRLCSAASCPSCATLVRTCCD